MSGTPCGVMRVSVCVRARVHRARAQASKHLCMFECCSVLRSWNSSEGAPIPVVASYILRTALCVCVTVCVCVVGLYWRTVCLVCAGPVFKFRTRDCPQELEEEKAQLRQRHKGLKKEHLQLLRDKSAKESKVAELEARAHDVQVGGFGWLACLVVVSRPGSG